jgi:chemotaxis family two-component system sensor kinase Cph1
LSHVEIDRELSGLEESLANCEREPIHIPGSIQAHGVLLVLSPADLTILQVSENVGRFFNVDTEKALGSQVGQVVGSHLAQTLQRQLESVRTIDRPHILDTISLGPPGNEQSFTAVVHTNSAGIILELEVAAGAQSDRSIRERLNYVSLEAEASNSIEELSNLVANEMRSLTGFDRVLVYQFDEEWNGNVVGESGNGRLPSLLYHRFPAFDIPAQARELYRANRIRIIPDSSYQSVPIVPSLNPLTKKPLDMSFATLRSVSPVHVEYMRNMETASSMSVSILREGKLWGLISCHHREPKNVPFEVRSICDFFARIFSLRISALEQRGDYERRIEVRSAFSKLLAVMAERGDYATALAEHPDELLAIANASGAAVLNNGQCAMVGKTPTAVDITELAKHLFANYRDELVATETLPVEYPPAKSLQDLACGVLAIAVSKIHPSYVMWFRPEVIQTIRWGGDPRKSIVSDPSGPQIHPRRSFATWQEQVRDKSLPWHESEIEGARSLRNAIVGIVLRKAEELASLNTELTRSNKELEAFSYSVSHDLRAPLRHIVGYAEMLKESDAAQLTAKGKRCVDTIIESSEYAGTLVDKLLAFSRMGRVELQIADIDMNALVRETQRAAMAFVTDRKIEWRIDDLPRISGDLMMVRQAIRNLFDNAIKYTREQETATIEVSCRDEGNEYVFCVRDNGVGFEQKYAGKLFGVFQRLHRMEDYEGTGIGLANVRRVMERHGGRTWAEGEPGKGATIFFSFPKQPIAK